jgi:hypothetical protein
VRILQRELDADAERIAVLRTVAIGTDPFGGAVVERLLEFGRAETEALAGLLVGQLAARQRLRIEYRRRGQTEAGRHLDFA